MKRQIYVPIGLPGSGKTTYFEVLSSDKKITRINMDKYIRSKLSDVLSDVLRVNGDLYLDGLFLSKEVQQILLDTNEDIIFCWFDLSRAECEANDNKRSRKIKSTATIRNAMVNRPLKYIEIKGNI